jgi:hypothetical protein
MKSAPMKRRASGDGGNRTRVRKTRPSKIYERSRLRLVATGHPAGKIDLRPAARARKPSFARSAASCAALHHCDAQSLHRVEYGTGGRGLARRPAVYSLLLTQRGAWRRRKCGWHLIFCAEFTRSAPLGSHSGTSLFRRSLSSPKCRDFPQSAGTFPKVRGAFPENRDTSQESKIIT